MIISSLSYSQISRVFLDYSVNNSEVVRRFYDKIITFETDDGDITLTVYSDSINLNQKTLNLLICYPTKFKDNNIKLIVRYIDKKEEIVPNFPDINNCSIYYFLNRLSFIHHKKVDSIILVSIDKFKMLDENYFIDFLDQINY